MTRHSSIPIDFVAGFGGIARAKSRRTIRNLARETFQMLCCIDVNIFHEMYLLGEHAEVKELAKIDRSIKEQRCFLSSNGSMQSGFEES